MIWGLLANWRVLGAAAALAALAGAWWWIDHRAYERGVQATTAAWQAREVAELQAANAEIVRLTAEVANRERQAAQAIAAADGRYQKELASVQAKSSRFRDDILSGRVRFYLPTPGQGSRPGAGPQTAAPASGSDGEARGELPAETARFLWGEATRANEIVVELTLAQGVIESYLEACR